MIFFFKKWAKTGHLHAVLVKPLRAREACTTTWNIGLAYECMGYQHQHISQMFPTYVPAKLAQAQLGGTLVIFLVIFIENIFGDSQ